MLLVVGERVCFTRKYIDFFNNFHEFSFTDIIYKIWESKRQLKKNNSELHTILKIYKNQCKNKILLKLK